MRIIRPGSMGVPPGGCLRERLTRYESSVAAQ
jgi:hypothetical protein